MKKATSKSVQSQALGPKYSVGDLVRLNSGGPAMTIQRVQPSEKYYSCVWYCPNSIEYKESSFYEEMISRVSA